MKYLLDTHVAIWWLIEDRKLSKEHARLIDRAERSGQAVGLSAISLWEIAKLVERGRLELTQSIDDCLAQLESSASLTIVPLTSNIAIESTRLGARFHSDPTDQLIAATARCHGLVLLTADQRIVDSRVVSVA